MSKLFFCTVLLIAHACAICVVGLCAESDDKIIIPVDKLDRIVGDEKVLAEFRAARRKLQEKFLAIFATSKANRQCYGKMHICWIQIGEWRLKECASLLIDNIEWEVDRSTVPVGDKLHPSFYFPCAQALVEIGGKEVRASVIQALRITDNDVKSRLLSWVLAELEGTDYSKKLKSLSEEPGTGKAVSDRLGKAASYVEKGSSIFTGLSEKK